MPGPQFRSCGTSRPAADQFFIQILVTPQERFVFELLSDALPLNVGHGVRAVVDWRSQSRGPRTYGATP